MAAVSMAVVVAGFMVAADLSAAAVENFTVAAPLAARGLLVEKVFAELAGLRAAGISDRLEIVGRIFTLQSTMANGIRLATPVVPHVPAQSAIPEAWRTQV